MRASKYLITTMREIPADAEVISHQLMLRAGMIRKVASGLYTWLPLGMKVLQKIIGIVRQEMNRSGALEVMMTSVQPKELWQETKRWEQFGDELLRFQDRQERDFVIGPTHEEVITDFARQELISYKQVPINLYQIQSKFRDERRPRYGVMRAREFLMKDAYSFHLTEECLKKEYLNMHDTYCRIFDRIGLEYRSVEADSGAIGGSGSMEFHVLAESGEDAIVFGDQSDYAVNIEKAEAVAPKIDRPEPSAEMTLVKTPDIKTVDQLSQRFDLLKEKIVKTLIVKASNVSDSEFIALLIRGDTELNEVKAQNLPEVASPLCFASDDEIKEIMGVGPGSLGPVNCPIPIIVDRAVDKMSDFVAGANIEGHHYFGVNWVRDCTFKDIKDLRNVQVGDPSPCGKGQLFIKRGIEVGHIFQLGKKYSEAMHAAVLNQNGKNVHLSMGCYGIGVSRIAAAAIEQNYDDRGIIWPESIAPFQIALVPLKIEKSEIVRKATEELYKELNCEGFEVLMDDRKLSPGVKFADMELIGIPHRVILSDKGLANGKVEYKRRNSNDKEDIELSEIIQFLKIHLQP